MPALEQRIDDLYKQPLGTFVAARGALAREIGGSDARRVKGLAKPTAVPWALNQLYWRQRPTYERLATLRVDTAGRKPAAVVAEIAARLQELEEQR